MSITYAEIGQFKKVMLVYNRNSGKQLSSPELAAKIDSLTLGGCSHITFVIGGAFGYTDALRRRADLALSFSKMTFTHQMIRLLLIEQIYRAFKISRGEKYHW